MPGRYTRTGDVRPLLAASDDSFVVSKPGDELALSFDARALPAPKPGFERTFLVHGDGFSKEMDINSASPDVVLPLPYHGMKAYPYAERDAPAHVRAAAQQGRAVEQPARGAPAGADRAVRGRRRAAATRARAGERRSATPPPPARPTCRTRRPARDEGEHRPHARDDRLGARGRRAVPAGAARRVPGVRARRAGVRERRPARGEAGRAGAERAHRPAAGEGAGARDLHPERDDDRERPALAGVPVQRDLPDRSRTGSSTSTAR